MGVYLGVLAGTTPRVPVCGGRVSGAVQRHAYSAGYTAHKGASGQQVVVGHHGAIALNYPEVNAILLEWSLVELLKKIVVNNLGQKEFFINKAVGWALREYSKTEPEWVAAFIAEYREKMAPLSVREASKYI